MRARYRCAALATCMAALTLAASGGAPAMAQTGCASKTNKPIAPDPSVSGFQLLSTGPAIAALPIRETPDRVNWCSPRLIDPARGANRILPQAPGWILPGSNIWAPELQRNVVVYSAVPNTPEGKKDPAARCIGMALPDPANPPFYRDFGPIEALCKGNKRFIDPSLFFDGAKRYLLYKEDPRGRGKSIVIRQMLSSGGLGRGYVILRPRDKRKGQSPPWEGNSVEAPKMIRRKNGKYYLFYSGGNFTTRSYGVGVAESGKPTAGFKRLGNKPIVGGKGDPNKGRCGVGHEDVTPGGSRIYFHAATLVPGPDCPIGTRPGTGRGTGKPPVYYPETRYLIQSRLRWGKRGPKLANSTASTAPPPPAPAPAPAPVPAPTPAPPPSPAPAPPPPQDVCVMHPSEPSVVCVRNGGHTVDVCDRENDTHRVYARVITEASNPNFQSPFYDDNGSNPGCGNFNFPSRVLSVAVCVQTEECSAFKPT